MNIRLAAILTLTLATLLAPRQSTAQQAAPGNNIAIVDMGVIFTQCVGYKAAVEGIKTTTLAEEGKLKTEYQNLQNMAKELQTKNPGTPDYRQLEASLAKMDLDFKYKTATARKDFEEKVNGIQYALFVKIDQVVKDIAVRNNISLVLRHNTSPVNGNDPQAVLRAINQSVVYYNPGLDITGLVLQVLNRDTNPIVPLAPAAVPNTANGLRPGAPGATMNK